MPARKSNHPSRIIVSIKELTVPECSDRILYKTRLPFILVFNKTDAQPHDFAIDWMQDFEAFQRALATHGRDQNGEPTYMNSLMSSMCLVLDEFYSHLRVRVVLSWIYEGTMLICFVVVAFRPLE